MKKISEIVREYFGQDASAQTDIDESGIIITVRWSGGNTAAPVREVLGFTKQVSRRPREMVLLNPGSVRCLKMMLGGVDCKMEDVDYDN